MNKPPILMWFRRDLRLRDHAALTAACRAGRPVIPVFIHDELTESIGAAAKMRLGLSVADLAKSLGEKGSKLILRRGKAIAVLRDLIAQTGAGAVYWSRLYDPQSRERDTKLKAALKDDGVTVESFKGHILFEPWTVETKTGGYYKIFTPMWKSVRGIDQSAALPEPGQIPAPGRWPQSDRIDDWHMDAPTQRGADVLKSHCTIGEMAAAHRLGSFIANDVANYARNRDLPAVNGTSGLSENLTYGEISPRTCWHAGWQALDDGTGGAETFLKELVWREFAYHLAYHTPHITTDNWKEDWNAFPWNTDERSAEVIAWKQGRTGIRFVDAAMREMYVTGRMHNRGRMIVASYLTKHLLSHWKIGQAWFADCLIDWDPCSNAMGWQWSAGSGPDATPYFRIFNPVTQLDRFDADRRYVKKWIAEGSRQPSKTALSYFDMIPRRWGMTAQDRYPDPIVPADAGRKRALEAYQNRGF